MHVIKHRIFSLSLLLSITFLTACSSHRLRRLTINGQQQYEISNEGCHTFIRALHNQTLGWVSIQFQLKKGMTVHPNSLKLMLDNQSVPVEKMTFRFYGEHRLADFTADKPGTLTIKLDKDAFAGQDNLELRPSDLITCDNGNLIRQRLEIKLKQ